MALRSMKTKKAVFIFVKQLYKAINLKHERVVYKIFQTLSLECMLLCDIIILLDIYSGYKFAASLIELHKGLCIPISKFRTF